MSADLPIARLFDLTGSVLGDRYEVLSKLGEGGMASVYEGRRIGLRNRVAIKVLKPELCEDESNVKRFLREAKAASVIGHENIVDIVDFGEVDSLPVYYVMEFLEGNDLKEELKKMGPLSWEQFGPLLVQICSALASAHDNGIIHRDVKPANIFLVSQYGGPPLVKVLDFGIAKVVDNGRGLTQGMTATNGILGTVAYMAPEQARGEQLDARTDIYQLGCVMYQMLTGKVPFDGRNPFVILGRHVNEAPRPLREARPEIPEAAESIVLTCLAKDPAERFQSMRALRNAVRGILPTEQESPDPLPPPSKPAPVELGQGSMGWAAPAASDSILSADPMITSTERLGSGSHKTVGGRVDESRPPMSRGPVAYRRAGDPGPAESTIKTMAGGATKSRTAETTRREPTTQARPGTATEPPTAPRGGTKRVAAEPTTSAARPMMAPGPRAAPEPRSSGRPSTLVMGFGMGLVCAAFAGIAYVVASEVRDGWSGEEVDNPIVIEAPPIAPEEPRMPDATPAPAPPPTPPAEPEVDPETPTPEVEPEPAPEVTPQPERPAPRRPGPRRPSNQRPGPRQPAVNRPDPESDPQPQPSTTDDRPPKREDTGLLNPFDSKKK